VAFSGLRRRAERHTIERADPCRTRCQSSCRTWSPALCDRCRGPNLPTPVSGGQGGHDDAGVCKPVPTCYSAEHETTNSASECATRKTNEPSSGSRSPTIDGNGCSSELSRAVWAASRTYVDGAMAGRTGASTHGGLKYAKEAATSRPWHLMSGFTKGCRRSDCNLDSIELSA
jgi:hypothetical protein